MSAGREECRYLLVQVNRGVHLQICLSAASQALITPASHPCMVSRRCAASTAL